MLNKALVLLLILFFLKSKTDAFDFIIETEHEDHVIEKFPYLNETQIMGRFLHSPNIVHLRHINPNKTDISDQIQQIAENHNFEKLPNHNVKKRLLFKSKEVNSSVSKRAKCLEKEIYFNDKEASHIWQYLDFEDEPVDLNVYPAWIAGVTGRNITVTIMDDGLDVYHQDLKENINFDASINLNEPEKFGWSARGPLKIMPPDQLHGTMCAGLVAGIANNTYCAHGIAYNAKVAGIRMLDGIINDALEGRSVNYALNITDIYTASWGPSDSGNYFQPAGRLLKSGFEHGTIKGRNGKGSLYIFAAGNGRQSGDNCGADGFVNDPNVIAVASIKEDGRIDSYSEFCSAVRISVPVGEFHGLPTTSGNGLCESSFIGTSAACPVAAACFALVLEKNPDLAYDDVMYIVALSGRIPKSKLKQENFQFNGAGFMTSSIFGSGLLDCNLMVYMASKWKIKDKLCQAQVVVGELVSKKNWSDNMNKRQSSDEGNRVISKMKKTNSPYKVYAKKEISIEIVVDKAVVENSTCIRHCKEELVNCQVERLETVSLEVFWMSASRGSLNFTLISPSGTESQLLFVRPKDFQAGKNYQLFSSSQFYGENSEGTWILKVKDNGFGIRGRLKNDVKGLIKGLKLILNGTPQEDSPIEKNKELLNIILSPEAKEVAKTGKAVKFNNQLIKSQHKWGLDVYLNFKLE